MAEVTNIGLEVFGEMGKFKLWLNTPVFSLGNNKPFELLRDSYGKEMVIDPIYPLALQTYYSSLMIKKMSF